VDAKTIMSDLNDFVGVDEIIKMEVSQSSIDEVKKFLESIPWGAKGVALKAFTEYIIGNQQHGLIHYPPYKYVTRKAAYGKTFFSDAQRGFVMAKIRSGEITPGASQRTGLQANSWGYRGESTRFVIFNTAPGSKFTMGNNTQADQPRMVGWRLIMDVISDNFNGGIRAAQQAVNRWLKEKKQ
jgi:hypothetical protein